MNNENSQNDFVLTGFSENTKLYIKDKNLAKLLNSDLYKNKNMDIMFNLFKNSEQEKIYNKITIKQLYDFYIQKEIDLQKNNEKLNDELLILDGNNTYSKCIQCIQYNYNNNLIQIIYSYKFNIPTSSETVKQYDSISITKNKQILLEDGSKQIAENIKIGDKLKGSHTNFLNTYDIKVEKINILPEITKYVYDINTSSQTFYTNGLTVCGFKN